MVSNLIRHLYNLNLFRKDLNCQMLNFIGIYRYTGSLIFIDLTLFIFVAYHNYLITTLVSKWFQICIYENINLFQEVCCGVL